MNLLECRQLSCRFGGTVALNKVDLAVRHGESVGIIGQNGAGKTTLLNAVCGLVPSGGTIRLSGVDVSHWPFARRARNGLIRSFEDSAIWQHLSVADNVAIGALGLSLATARRSAERWLEVFGLLSRAADAAESLSLGERKKVDLARILLRKETVTNPPLVVLDEPTRGLDDDTKTEFQELVREHLIGQCGVLVVEHDLTVASRLCSRLVHLRAGSVVDGPDLARQSDKVEANTSGTCPLDSKNVIRMEGVYAGYGSVEVLRGVSLALADGEAIQLKGLNGSGKSTLLRVLVGSLKPSHGCVDLFGHNVNGDSNRVAEGLGYAPQGGRLIRDLSVETHVQIACQIALSANRKAWFDRRFCEMFPEVRGLGPSRAGDLSSGQRSLVSLWVALATEPRILLADEPGAGLASDLRQRLYDFLRTEWIGSGRSLIFVEHGAPQPWARQVLMERGAIKE